MSRVRKYLEGQSASITFYFYEDDGSTAATPTTARYRIDCLTTGRPVTDWTTLTVGSSITISITPTENRILNSRNKQERRQIVLQTEYGTNSQEVFKRDWIVENLQGVT